jgi:hypothetical protein
VLFRLELGRVAGASGRIRTRTSAVRRRVLAADTTEAVQEVEMEFAGYSRTQVRSNFCPA